MRKHSAKVVGDTVAALRSVPVLIELARAIGRNVLDPYQLTIQPD